MDERDRRLLVRAADYQFGAGAGATLFADAGSLSVSHTKSGRPRQVHAEAGRLVTYTRHGRFTLGVEGGRRLHAAGDPPDYRVVVGDESEPYVRDGHNAFAKFVTRAGAAIRPGDETLVVSLGESLLGVGRAELSAGGMADFETGVAVSVREGNPERSGE